MSSNNAPQFILAVPSRSAGGNSAQCRACRLPISKSSIRLASKTSKSSAAAPWTFDHLSCLRTGTISQCLSTYGLTTSATDLSPIPGFETLSSAQQKEVRDQFHGILSGQRDPRSLSTLEASSNEALRRQQIETSRTAKAAAEAIRSKKKARRAIPLSEYDWRSELETGDLNAEDEAAKFLRALCKHLSLKQTGNNATLIARLKARAKVLGEDDDDGEDQKKPAAKKRKVAETEDDVSSSDEDDGDDGDEEIVDDIDIGDDDDDDDDDDGCQGFKDCRVAKIFGGKIYLGTITGSDDDEDNEGERLYHVVYEDGDEEDFTVSELYAAIELYEKEYLVVEDTRVRVVEEDSEEEEEEENVGTFLEEQDDELVLAGGKENPPVPQDPAPTPAQNATKANVGKSSTSEPHSILRDQLHQSYSPATARKVRTRSVDAIDFYITLFATCTHPPVAPLLCKSSHVHPIISIGADDPE